VPEPVYTGTAYITVTDAAGRVLFRRQATQNEVQDALRSATTATSEGAAAMERIRQERLFNGLHPFGEPPDDFGVAPVPSPIDAGAETK
jgi:hypothetical protein